MEPNISLKTRLIAACKSIQQERVENARRAMLDAQKSANEEEKSTAGDKYDTARAMSQNLRDMNAKQMDEANKLLNAIDQINPNSVFDEVRPGAVVQTNLGNYFIAGSVGQVKIDNETYFAISLQAPIGAALSNKKSGDKVQFNGKEFHIKKIF